MLVASQSSACDHLATSSLQSLAHSVLTLINILVFNARTKLEEMCFWVISIHPPSSLSNPIPYQSTAQAIPFIIGGGFRPIWFHPFKYRICSFFFLLRGHANMTSTWLLDFLPLSSRVTYRYQLILFLLCAFFGSPFPPSSTDVTKACPPNHRSTFLFLQTHSLRLTLITYQGRRWPDHCDVEEG